MNFSPAPEKPLGWSPGAIIGSVVGGSLWMPVTAFVSKWPLPGVILGLIASGLVIVIGFLTWRKRSVISLSRARYLLLGITFLVTLGFLLGAHGLKLEIPSEKPGGEPVPVMSLRWMLLLFPALAVVIWLTDRKNESSAL